MRSDAPSPRLAAAQARLGHLDKEWSDAGLTNWQLIIADLVNQLEELQRRLDKQRDDWR